MNLTEAVGVVGCIADNGEYQNMGCGKCKLADGDVVRWDYTCDLGLDLDADMPGAQEWMDTHE